mgnify:FL=1|jgi:DNA-dependent RNA polymerase auxiliary subunit epsilon
MIVSEKVFNNFWKEIDNVNTYHVGVTMHNSFYIEASTEDEARQKVQDMEATDLLYDVDFNITYIDKGED